MENKRYYPQAPSDLNEAHKQILDLHDQTYELRDRVEKMEKGGGAATEKPTTPAFTGDIQGIRIKAVTGITLGSTTTTQGGIKNGDTLRYNAATGQFEFGT